MDPINQAHLTSLMSMSRGKPDIVIGLIDGPVDFSHRDFQDAKIGAVKESYSSTM